MPKRNTAALPGPGRPCARLIDMLAYMRPAGSAAEAEFVDAYVAPTGAQRDDFGNYWLTISTSRVIWSSHTDTVHAEPGKQRVDVKDGILRAPRSSCLGADCTVGVWLMLEMIEAKIPGCYIFHRDEEIGGRGSSYIAKHYADVLESYDYAIAFDRRGTRDIITFQGGRRSASDAFAASIAPMLPSGFKASPDGIFTDTANYTSHIRECTNLSVGYFDEHHSSERLDVNHALALRAAMLAFDESRLVAARDKTEIEWDYADFRPYMGKGWALDSGSSADLVDFCRSRPNDVADFLETQGYSVDDLLGHAGY